MTVDQARKVALSFSEAYESSHHGHPDFRIPRGGIFATLWPDKGISVLRLPLEMAEGEATRSPGVCRVVSRSGGMGWLSVSLANADPEELRPLMEIAWYTRGGR